MPSPLQPDTTDVANALQTYLQAVNYLNTSTPVYVASGVVHGRWKDPSANLPANSSNVLGEIHGRGAKLERYASGGRVKDYANFLVVSFTDMSNSSAAWQRIYTVRDAMAVYVTQHTQLAAAGNLLKVRLYPDEEYVEVQRGKWYLAHVCRVEALSEWVVSGGFVI